MVTGFGRSEWSLHSPGGGWSVELHSGWVVRINWGVCGEWGPCDGIGGSGDIGGHS